MLAVGDQRGRANLPSHSSAVQRNGFVSEEAYDGRYDNPADVCDRGRLDDLSSAFVARHPGAQQDHAHDENASQVLGTAVTIREPSSGLAPTQREGYPEGNSRKSV